MSEAAEALSVAQLALEGFRAGWATGSWSAFLALLAEDYTQRVPLGEVRGRELSKREAVRHYRAMTLLGVRLQLGEPFRTAASDTGATFELEVSGELYGLPYRNRLALSFDVAAGRITALREYFGELDKDLLERALKRP